MLDATTFGRLARAARIMAGYDRQQEAAEAFNGLRDFTISVRTLGAVERGEVVPTVEFLMAATAVYNPPGGLAYWVAAVRDDMRQLVLGP
ncbi:MAG: helix-turn-helix domain-containing protein [Actinomycetota bacterium]